LPDGLTFISHSAFNGCSSLTHISLPDSIKYIGMSAFSGCISLIHVTLPDSITFIGKGAFKGCGDDLTLTVSEGSYAAQYAKENGLPYTFGSDWLN